MTMFRVTAPYVTVRVDSATGGETVLGFYEGGVLPENANPESVESLLAKEMIEKIDDGEASQIEKSEADQAKAREAVAKKAADERAEAREEAAKKAADERAKTEKPAPAAKSAPTRVTGRGE
jgi:hypothetical protein